MKAMRVLLTNHHLHERAGSELSVSELASALKDRGHDARIFTLLPGALADQLKQSGFNVYTPDDFAEVEKFAPEVAHVHHGPCLWWVGAISLSCPVVYSSLGVIPPHEAAPPAWPGIALAAAVSEEVRTKLASTPFGKAVELHVMRNWFDDRGMKFPKAVAPKAVRRVAVVSNHLTPELAQQITDAGVEWTHFGLPDNSVEMTPAVLAPFDAVVCIGRTALLAAVLGKPVILYDFHGCDGVLDATRLDELAAVNFSGRLTRSQPSVEELRSMIAACTKLDVAALQRAVKKHYALTIRVAEWEGLYERAIASGTRLNAEHQLVYRPMFDLYWEQLKLAHRQLPAQLNQLREALAVEQRHLREANDKCTALEAKADELEARANQARAYSKALHDEVEQLRAELDEANNKLHAPGADDALRIAERANELRTSLLPEGTKRLSAFRTALHWARKKSR
jgi:DNA-binding transcriptional ArsR family regulator